MMMRILICLMTLSSFNNFASEVDWQKLDNEMKFLQDNAFVPTKTLESKTEQSPNLTLRRKPKKSNHTNDPNIEPLESQYFDSVNFKYSAAKKEKIKETPASKKRPEIKINGGLPKIN